MGAAHHVSVSLPLGIDLAAVIVGSLFGALVAVRRDLDALGTIGLAVCGGLGGGVVRDLLLNVMPVALTKGSYLPVAVGTGVFALVIHPYAEHLDDLLDVADAFALGLFAVVGASKALDLGLAAVPSAAVGVVAATAGGVLTDLLSGRRPYIFGPGPVYGLAAAAGSATFVAVQALADSIGVGLAAALIVTVALRLLAVHRGLSTSPAARRRRRRAGSDRAR